MAKIDRRAANRALAKAIAYNDCDKPLDKRAWVRDLMQVLDCEDMLLPGLRLSEIGQHTGADDE
jgi:hypothetical protein